MYEQKISLNFNEKKHPLFILMVKKIIRKKKKDI